MRTGSSAYLSLVGVLLLAGCAGAPIFSGEPTPSGEDAIVVTVVNVADGDTVDVRYDNGTKATVRLLGVDTPEVHTEVATDEFEGVPDTSEGRECLRRWGSQASEHTEARLARKRVTLRFDARADRRGGFGRLLAYIVVDGENYNRHLVAEGYARVYDTTFSESGQFYEAERDARDATRGVWECQSAGS
jgi:micrococcal nuclease